MLAGLVSTSLEPIASVRLRGRTGTEIDLFATIDSGFNG